MDYELLKLLHILSAGIMLGTSVMVPLSSALRQFRQKAPPDLAVLLQDETLWFILIPLGLLLQLTTGAAMIRIAHFAYSDKWLQHSLFLITSLALVLCVKAIIYKQCARLMRMPSTTLSLKKSEGYQKFLSFINTLVCILMSMVFYYMVIRPEI